MLDGRGPLGVTLKWYAVGGASVLWYLYQSSVAESQILAAAAGETTDMGATLKARFTTYYPYKEYTSAADALMEGGSHDSAGRDIITLEQHAADPQRYPYVSVSGDNKAWPYGQRISIDAWPGYVFRVVDTGGSFRGVGKLYRLAGYEPLDIASDYPPAKHPTTGEVTILAGDDWAAQKPSGVSSVDPSHFLGQEDINVG